MAGGKETPRQKMIGMMYLVLTALLALNVSKSILDAFVAIEENIQKANLTELYRGNEKREELKETASDKSNPGRAAKAEILGTVIAEIDKLTAERIKLIDDIKYEVLEACGEDMNATGAEAIVITKYSDQDPCKPARMNLAHVNGKDKYDDPMRVLLGDATDIKKPTGRGMELWQSILDFRKKITEKIAATQVISGANGKVKFDTRYSFKAPEINEFEDQADLNKQLRKAIEGSNVHPDDVELILSVYSGLTKEEYSTVHDVKGVHWMGKTFDHSPSVAAIASLSSLQKDILNARAQAVTMIRQRVGGGEYSFNKIIPLAYGPEVVNANEEFTVEVLMAAYDSDKQPKVVYNGEEIKDVRDGKGYIKLTGGSGKMELSGTVAIQNKSGLWKEKKWSKTVTVMKPAGAIEIPAFNVLYRKYDNIVNATASGFPTTILSGSNASVTKSGDSYVVRPGNGNTAYLTVSGKTSDGRTVQLKKTKYSVKTLPDPVLFLGSSMSGGDVTSSRLLQAKMAPGIPLNAQFRVVSWECSASGMSGAPKRGTGGNLSGASAVFNAARPGTSIIIAARVVGPDGIVRNAKGVWTKR